MTITTKISTFINLAITKRREIGTLLVSNYDRDGYQSKYSRELLTKIAQTSNFLALLVTEKKGGLTEKEISVLIDFYYKWLELEKVVQVNYTNYTLLVYGQTVLVPANLYALQADLDSEIAARIAADNAILSLINLANHVVVTKAAHGFAVKDVITINDAGVLVKVSDPQTEKRIGLVVEVIDADNFRLALNGYVKNLSGLVAGNHYYAQADATIDTVATGMPVLVADSTTSGYLLAHSFLDDHRTFDVDVSAAVILDMKKFKNVSFKPNAIINGPRNWSIPNAANAKKIHSFPFELDGDHAQTMPAGTNIADPRFQAGVWTPNPDEISRKYVMNASFDGATWWMEIKGPFKP